MITITIPPKSSTRTLIANVNTSNSTLNGSSKHALLKGSRWSVGLNWSNIKGRDAQKLAAQLASLMGPVNQFRIKVPSYTRFGTCLGAGEVVSGVINATEITTEGWDADQELLLAAGDWIEVASMVYRVVEDVASNEDGEATIKITPPLRRNVTPGVEIDGVTPHFTLRMIDNSFSESPTPVFLGPVLSFGIDAVEVD